MQKIGEERFKLEIEKVESKNKEIITNAQNKIKDLEEQLEKIKSQTSSESKNFLSEKIAQESSKALVENENKFLKEKIENMTTRESELNSIVETLKNQSQLFNSTEIRSVKMDNFLKITYMHKTL